MNLENYYWYFQSALSNKFCDDVIAHGNAQQEKIAITGGLERRIKEFKDLGKKIKRTKANKHLTDDQIIEDIITNDNKFLKDLKKQRNSNVAWLNDQWIYNEIQPYINMANKSSGWNFDWDYSESCQFTKYKLNQFYDWHCDSWEKPYDNPNNLNFHKKIRKLSVTCSLSDPKDYKGGQLEFQFRNNNDPKGTRVCKEIMPRGSIVVFPSFVWHRVKPVTKGTRYSLVIWNVGYPFK
jgi:PKHD-type hydroxylase